MAAGAVAFISPMFLLDTAGATGSKSRLRAKPTFAHVKGFMGLKWKMDVSQVMAELKRRSIKFKEEWMRGHFPAPPAGRKGSGAAVANCVTFHRLTFKKGTWDVTAAFTGYLLHSVTLFKRGLAGRAAVAAVVKGLEQKYGRPKNARPPSQKNGGWIARWSNSETLLKVDAYFWKGRWNLLVVYSSAARSSMP